MLISCLCLRRFVPGQLLPMNLIHDISVKAVETKKRKLPQSKSTILDSSKRVKRESTHLIVAELLKCNKQCLPKAFSNEGSVNLEDISSLVDMCREEVAGASDAELRKMVLIKLEESVNREKSSSKKLYWRWRCQNIALCTQCFCCAYGIPKHMMDMVSKAYKTYFDQDILTRQNLILNNLNERSWTDKTRFSYSYEQIIQTLGGQDQFNIGKLLRLDNSNGYVTFVISGHIL